MRDHYDFKNAIKNPYADKFKNGYTIVIEHEDHDEIITVKKTRREKAKLSQLELAEHNGFKKAL